MSVFDYRASLLPSAVGVDYTNAPLADDLEWQLHGMCNQYDPSLWYPDPPQIEAKSSRAKSICQSCPVLDKCKAWALTKHELYGVWGGLSEIDRDEVWRGRRKGSRRGTVTVVEVGV